MTPWRSAFREGLVTGTVAAVLSSVVLMATGRLRTGHAAAPVNAVGHWLLGREALRADRPTWRHTATGWLTHHAASVFWATLQALAWNRPPARRSLPRVLAAAAATSAVAAVVDYRVVPERLTPGFEHRLPGRDLALAYAALAVGLAVGMLALRASPFRRPGHLVAVDRA